MHNVTHDSWKSKCVCFPDVQKPRPYPSSAQMPEVSIHVLAVHIMLAVSPCVCTVLYPIQVPLEPCPTASNATAQSYVRQAIGKKNGPLHKEMSHVLFSHACQPSTPMSFVSISPQANQSQLYGEQIKTSVQSLHPL
jgi:hypothetical protein